MADKFTTTNELKIGFTFKDGDTRLVTIPNPKSGITADEVSEATAEIITNKLLVGDQTQAEITGVYTAYVENKSIAELDLES